MKKPQIRWHLLWEYNKEKFNFRQSANIVIERVIERGTPEEWREIIRFYGKDKIMEVTQKSKQLDAKNRNFAYIYLQSTYNDF
jgi:hypothetical protein